jgi:hypothetical protein
VLIAGSVDLSEAIRNLGGRREVFHSEADFQFALAWEVQGMDPLMKVYLEPSPEPGVHLDILFVRPDRGRSSAVELKYLTRAFVGEVGGQRFALTDQSAQDNRRYDVVKDVRRVEDYIQDRAGADGAVVVLTNDSGYWRPPVASRIPANDVAFRISEGLTLDGTRSWLRERPYDAERGEGITLRGRYPLHWSLYPEVASAEQVHEFRILVIEIDPISS